MDARKCVVLFPRHLPAQLPGSPVIQRTSALRCRLLASLAAAVLIGAAAQVPASADRGPDHLYDMVPADPPAPGPERLPRPAPEVQPAAPVPSAPPSKPVTPAPQPPAPSPSKPATPPAPKPAVPASLPDLRWLTPALDSVWREGETVAITWQTNGRPSAVRLYYSGEKCRLGGKSRGSFAGIIGAKMVPNNGKLTWKVPWLDGPSLNLRLTGFDADGKPIAELYRQVWLMPREFANLPRTCIAISKRLQRLYYREGGKTKRMHLVSTAAAGYITPRMKPGGYFRGRGSTGRVFNKAYNPYSSLYHVNMPYWLGITASGSHGIHATSPPFYRLLGRPASHGCVRQHRADARALWEMVRTGTPVYIF